MAKSTKAARGATKARNAVGSVGDNPYLRRLMEDDDLRDSLRDALDAARDAYDRLSSNGSVIDTAIDDKKVHKDLKTAAENLRDASNRIRGKQKKRRWGRLLLVAVAGATLALVLSEDLRKAVLDKVFGAEEEFEYTSTTTPEPAPAATE
jgi:hypothetical protein